MTDEKRFTGWKRTYIGLLNTVTVICIILGCIIHIGGFIGADILKSLFDTGRTGSNIEGGTAGFEETLKAFDKIEGELAIGSLTIKYGDDYTVSYENYPEKEVPTWKVSGGTLKISQKTKKAWKLGGMKNGYNGAEVVITIPKDATPDVSLEMNMGTLKAEKGMTFGDVNLDADMGSIELTGCRAKDLELNADMGAITIENTSFDEADINASMGGITLKDVTFDEADLKADMGSIEVSGTFEDLEAKCSMGSIEVTNHNKDAKLDLKADMGDVSYNGEPVGKSYKK